MFEHLDLTLTPLTAILWLLVGLAGVWDVAQRRIPNGLILIGLLLGAALQTQAGGFAGLGSAILGAAAGLGLLIVPFALKMGVGGGDVKLTMVCGAFLGWLGAVEVTLLATVINGLGALGVVLTQVVLKRLGRAPGKTRGLPYAVAVAVAVVLLTSGAVRLGWGYALS